MGHGSIQITTAEAGRLKIVLPYHPNRVATIKRVKGCRWHPEGRYWTVPRTDQAVSHLLTLFAGEPVEVDPSLRPASSRHGGAHLDVPVNHTTVPRDHPLLERVRLAARTRHLSHHTEQAYCHWIKRFMIFHHLRPVADLGEPDIAWFLSSLATASHVSASTQNQALNALLFLYHWPAAGFKDTELGV